jgi:hypothetical protein
MGAEVTGLIQTAIKQIPWLLWPLFIALFIWGLVLIVKQLYTLGHQVRRNYIAELKDHINFKETVIKDISDQNAQLATQCDELRMEAQRKQEIINTTVESAIVIVTEKDAELQKLKNDHNMTIQRLRYALGTALWVMEREISIRKLFFTMLTKSQVPSDIDKFLTKYIKPIISIIKSDDDICYQEDDTVVASDFLESRAIILSPYYLSLPMTEEISLFTNIRDEIMTLPSFVDSQDSPK